MMLVRANERIFKEIMYDYIVSPKINWLVRFGLSTGEETSTRFEWKKRSFSYVFLFFFDQETF